MLRQPRPRRLARAALTVALAASSVVVAACQSHPNTIFTERTDFNRDVGFLFDLLIVLGTIVFVFVEAILIYALVRFRRRGAPRQPEHVHGNTTLEILWTIIPAVILVIIAIPTVRTIFRTSAVARADALQVEVVGHQWWWEFRYPQYTMRSPTGKLDTVVTANELYLPIGRTVNFLLTSKDVVHSFWVPSLAGKRDLIPNHVNYLWFTPDSTTSTAFNGFCAEFCGASHANMRFRTFTVSAAEFQSWIAHQQSSAAFTIAPPAPPAPPPSATTRPGAAGTPAAAAAPGRRVAAAPPPVAAPAPAAQTPPIQSPSGFLAFASESLPPHTVPNAPVPTDISFDESLQGDAARGADLLTKGQGACLGCHVIRGNPSMIGTIGPSLTHVGSRTSIAGGLFVNDRRHLALWIKNARKMKPGVLMPTLGVNQYDPVTKATVPIGLTDQQIADIVAYLQALK